MIPSYKMVVVNIIILIVLGVSLFLYRYFLKKRVNLFFLLLLISILPLVSIFRQGTYESGDLSLHGYASLSFYNALLSGQFVPRWGGDLINGFGSPYHMVMYSLPYYLISFFHLLGFTIINSIKSFLILAFITSGVSMYFLVKENYSQKAAFTAAIFYLFAPYHLVDMHFRVDIGEMASFALLPLTFLFIDRIIKKPTFYNFLLEELSVAFLILSHQAISLFFVPFIFIYCGIRLFKRKVLIAKESLLCFGSIACGILLTSFYAFPIIFEATKFTYFGKQIISSNIYHHNITEYLWSPWRLGLLFQGPTGQLSYAIGYTQILIVIFSLFLLVKSVIKKNDKVILSFLLISFSLVFFIMLPQSNFLWNIIPFTKYSLSTYRYLLLLSFFVAIIAGIVVDNFKNRIFFIFLCFLTIVYTLLNWGNRGNIPTIAEDSYFEQGIPTYILGTDGKGGDFASSIWLDLKKSNFRKKANSHIELISGVANYKKLYRNSTTHEYLIKASSPSIFQENTIYYPGWKLYANGKEVKIEYEKKENPGIVTFKLPKGIYRVVLIFENTLIRTIGDLISIISIVLIALFLFYKRFRGKVS